MIRRIPLRVRLLLLTLPPIVVIVAGTLAIFGRAVSQQADATLRGDLRRASGVLEDLLATRAHELAGEAQVIAQDPKFFATLTIPGGAADPTLRETMAGVARDFNAIVGHDVFDVLDESGALVASVGRESVGEPHRAELARPALEGRPVSRTVLVRGVLVQVNASPVVAGGRVVGVLVLGARVGGELAEQLKTRTRSEVSFLSGGVATASTLEEGRRTAVLAGAPLRPLVGDGLSETRVEDDVFLTLVRPLPNADPALGQRYVLQRSLRAEFAGLRRAQAEMLGLGLVVLAVAVLVNLFVSSGFVAPIQRMVRASEAMEHGDYEAPLDRARRDELGDLAGRFDAMRQSHRRYVSSLEEVTRLKSEFISVASHELRTPISVIQGYQEMMSQRLLGPVSAEQREALDAIGHSARTLLKIAEDATRFAQIRSTGLRLERAEARVGELVEAAVRAALAAGPDRRVSVTTEVAPGLDGALLDAAQSSECLFHLVANGIRFTPDGGHVVVRARRHHDRLELEVEDDGVGIEPERHATLFDRSITVYDHSKHHSSATLEFGSAGLGLGLSIARGVVEAHGGTIELESAPGVGSRFTIRIPAYGALRAAA